ncbi:hypothetical protein CHS0354_007660 [Potamilus streckersoni]|uniref:Metalloendopeptidase n=1 Tax=Potamilus streckersoni TaxID=2493646 RepID=A0AAE0VV40_9BIVA|nr:hypothetical protein CHS0354_007660 [Potamilus streckersoni]
MKPGFLVLLMVFFPIQMFPLEASPKLNTNHIRLASGEKLSHLHQPMEGNSNVGGTYEADMKLTPLQQKEIIDGIHTLDSTGRSKRKVVKNRSFLWPKGIIVYKFNDAVNGLPNHIRNTVESAMDNWEKTTCLRFQKSSEDVKWEVGHSNYVLISKGSGCSSYVGMVNDGPQEITISESCNNVVSIAHEIGHSFGFYHEQSRPDRDYFVNIRHENIKPGFQGDFKKYDRQIIDTSEMYDIGSVMHYGPTWFSKDNNSQTIEPIDKGLLGIMGQRDELSFIDIKTANALYTCNAVCTTNMDCKNEGYIGPNCTCVCPPALSGRKCEHIKRGTQGCGYILNETSGTFTSPNFPGNYAENTDCYWLIQSQQKSAIITVTFDTYEMEDDALGCGYDWLEIRKYGIGLAGPRFCANGPSSKIVYNGPALMLHFHSDDRHSFKGFRAAYTIASK